MCLLYEQVVNCLLEHGCDPTIQDRSGLTALSSVRTLSQPYEEIVKSLASAEKANEHSAFASFLFWALSLCGAVLFAFAHVAHSFCCVNDTEFRKASESIAPKVGVDPTS